MGHHSRLYVTDTPRDTLVRLNPIAWEWLRASTPSFFSQSLHFLKCFHLFCGSLYCSFLHMGIRVWGLIENLKRRALLVILGIEITLKSQVCTYLGTLGLAINIRHNYPNSELFRICQGYDLCGKHTLVADACQYHVWLKARNGGMGRNSRLECVSIPSLGSGWVDGQPSFSLNFFIFLHVSLFSCLH